MNLNTKIIFTLGLAILILVSSSCNSPQSQKPKPKREGLQTMVNYYELADEFLAKLKMEKTDTIIFYKRTCINCCDFFNIFWVAKGQRHLSKIYFDSNNMPPYSKTITLANDKIFELLKNNFSELKSSSIKENVHKNKDGTSSITMSDHYCYTQIRIYTNKDSIIADRVKDHDFDKYTGFGFHSSENKYTNDNYVENINSKWNVLLTAIETEISGIPGITDRELETLRTRQGEN